MSNCFDFIPGHRPVNLCYLDQDINQQKDERVVGFGLRLLIGTYLALHIISEGPESCYAAEHKEKNAKDNQAEKLEKQRGSAGNKNQQENKKKAAATSGLFVSSIFHCLIAGNNHV
jgi:hypothetical protein